MTILIKNIEYTYIPGDPGVAGTPGFPYQPPYCVFVPGQTITTATATSKIQKWVATPDNPLTPGYEGGGYFVWVTVGSGSTSGSGSSYTLPGITTCYDAVPAVAGVAYEPPTPSQVLAYFNDGWNSHSRSISSLDNNEIFYCTVSPGTVGGFISIGKKGMDGRTLGSFSHGVLIDTNGVYVYENGLKVATISSSIIGNSELRINRRIDNSIEYSIGTGAYTSLLDFSVANGISAYVYAYLYSGGDSLLTAGLETGEWDAQYGSTELDATSSLSVHDTSAGASLESTSSLSAQSTYAGAELEATSSLTVGLSPLASLAATSSLFALSTFGFESNTILGALNGACGEVAFMFQPTVDLGGLTTDIVESNILPATPLRFLGNLSSIVGTSALVGIQTNDCEGDLVASKPTIEGVFGAYGEIDVPLATISGVLLAPLEMFGDLNIPKAEVSGVFNTTRVFIGDLNIPLALVEGTLISGDSFNGTILAPKARVSGIALTVGDFEGDLSAPIPKVSGVIASTVDDSVWSYSGDITCQQ